MSPLGPVVNIGHYSCNLQGGTRGEYKNNPRCNVRGDVGRKKKGEIPKKLDWMCLDESLSGQELSVRVKLVAMLHRCEQVLCSL